MSKDRGGEGRIETRGNRAFVTISVGLLRKRGQRRRRRRSRRVVIVFNSFRFSTIGSFEGVFFSIAQKVYEMSGKFERCYDYFRETRMFVELSKEQTNLCSFSLFKIVEYVIFIEMKFKINK